MGVAYLQFEIGMNNAGWLARLARSSWFAGLEPQADDLAVSGGVPCGTWVMPDGWAAAGSARVVTETEAFFTSEPLPSAWLAAVAVPHGAGMAGQAAALGLVGALRARRDPDGRALRVVVTVEAAPSQATDTFVRMLLDRRAFVVRPGAGPGTDTAGDHLHHLPLRTLTNPHGGRLIGVDFADYLHVWRPGRVADLHVLPFASGDAGLALSGLPSSAGEGVRALSLGFHLDQGATGQGLVEADRFASRCREVLLGPDGVAVFTTMDRLDGVTGSVDLLIIYDNAEASR